MTEKNRIRFETAFFSLMMFSLCLLCSCMSTRVYVESSRTFYEDGTAMEGKQELYLDNQLKKTSSQKFYDLAEVSSEILEDDNQIVMNSFTAVKDSNSKKQSSEITFSLMEYKADKKTKKIESYVLGSKKVKAKNGKVSVWSGVKGDDFSDKNEDLFDDTLDEMVSYIYASDSENSGENEAAENAAGEASGTGSGAATGSGKGNTPASKKESRKMQDKSSSERVTVESVPNGPYIFYQIAGKPFVILGVASWNIIKCFGYAVWNFGSGYNLINGKYTGGLWTFPNYEKTKARAEVAKEENRIQYYPQYHLPFTNNHIYVEKYDRDISVTMLEDGKTEEIVPVESYEVDNSLSVKRSAAADAASTAAITGLIGTVITIPISAISWVGGIVAGVAVNFM